MTAFRPAPVEVRPLSDGTVAVGRIGVEDVLVSSTALTGATLTVDLDRLDAVPSLVITNVSAASWWVAHVHGEAVAAAVLQAAAGDASRVRAEPGELAAPVLRFAVGRWLHRWWPSGRPDLEELGDEPERWLETELGVLAWWADQAFGGPATAAQLLSRNVEHVMRFGRSTADRVRPVAALRAVIECVDVPDDRYTELALMERALTAAAGVVSGVDFDSDLHGLVLRERANESGADRYGLVQLRAALGAPDRPADDAAVPENSSVDWSRVPPRIVSGADGAVRWSITTADGSGGAQIAVSVPAGRRWSQDEVFGAVYRNSAEAPEIIVPLAADSATVPTMLSGVAALAPVAAGDTFRVEIFAECWLDVDEPSLARRADRDRVVRRIETLLRDRLDVDADAAPYDLDPGEWPFPPARATWGAQ